MVSPPAAKAAKKSGTINWRIEENREKHRTKDFEDVLFIVRRGFPIRVAVSDGAAVSVVKVLSCGTDKGKKPKSAAKEVSLTPAKPACAGWKLQEDVGIVAITPPANCGVGRWTLSVTAGGSTDTTDLIILFNPWCKLDEVFLDDSRQLDEYVMADTGLVFGTSSWRLDPEGWGWVFGQFDSKVLHCVLFLLENCNLSAASKSSAVFVSRAMTAMVNSQDEGGVLEGNWSGDYSGGKDPSEWASSVDILLEYFDKKKTVKYGQCWVFSGVLVTVLRALGIPCRSVTNYRSAHDTELNMAIDIYHDKRGEKIEGDDSVWNFHLWNEIWTRRDDLPSGNDGWQALDATPQEMSEGMFQAGPAPLKAIKSGNVYLPFDCRFIFAEVNADRVYWFEDEDGNYEIKKIDKTHVGRMVVTKAVGANQPEYITQQYKHEEGSWEERHQTRLAVTFGTEPDLYEYCEKTDEIDMQLKCDFDYITIGEPVQYTLDLSLVSLPAARAHVVVTGGIYNYNGKFLGRAGVHKFDLSLPEQDKVSGIFPPEQYSQHADFRSFLRLSVMYDLRETRDMGFCEEEIPLRAPPPVIDVSSSSGDGRRVFKSGEKMKLSFELTNKFQTTLTGGFFKLNAPGFSSRRRMEIGRDLARGESCTYSVEYTAGRPPGDVNLVCSFSSDQHRGLQAYTCITVQ